MKAVEFSLRALRRDWRAGELKVLVAALVIAVASITSVGFFTDRVRVAMGQQAAELLAADLAVNSTRAAPPAWTAQAAGLGVQTARMANFPSVVLAGDNTQLVDVKAVSDGYPLRGQLRLTDVPFGAERPARGIPDPGTVWVDARLLGLLGLGVGGHIDLGLKRLPSHRSSPTSRSRRRHVQLRAAPVMNYTDLDATGLLGPVRGSVTGCCWPVSRAAGDAAQLAGSAGDRGRARAGRARRAPGTEGRARARREIPRLAALVSVVLAGVAVATARAAMPAAISTARR